MRTTFGVLAVVLGLTGCRPNCGPEVRQTGSGVELRDAQGAGLAHIDVVMTEERGERDSRMLSVYFQGPGRSTTSPLRGHITGARLLRATGERLYTVTVRQPGEYTGVIALTMTEFGLAADRYEAIRQDLIAGRVVVEITTDLPGMETLSVAMPAAPQSAFMQRKCPIVMA